MFELLSPVSLSLVVFRLRPASLADDEVALDKLNRQLYNRINARRDIMLTQTLLGKVFCIRWAIGAESTRWEDVEGAWESVMEEVKGVLGEREKA